MAAFINEGTGIAHAVKWISDEHKLTGKPDRDLINEAMIKFDLSPLDGEFLIKHLKNVEE